MARVAARVETTLWFRVRGLLISAQVAPAPRRVRASRVSPLVSGDYDAAGGGVRGVGLEPLVRRDPFGALQLHGLIGIVSIGQALGLGRPLLGLRGRDAALAFLFSSGVDAARVALAFCVDETS